MDDTLWYSRRKKASSPFVPPLPLPPLFPASPTAADDIKDAWRRSLPVCVSSDAAAAEAPFFPQGGGRGEAAAAAAQEGGHK